MAVIKNVLLAVITFVRRIFHKSNVKTAEKPESASAQPVSQKILTPQTPQAEIKMKIPDDILQAIKLPTKIKWNYIVIHHSATVDGKTNDWDSIRKWHTGKTGVADSKSKNYNPYIVNPMFDIGYHFGIEQDQDKLVYRIGRPLTMTGAHAVGLNGSNPKYAGIGICVIGNFDKNIPSKAQCEMLIELCRAIQKQFSISAEKVIGHRDTYTFYKKPVLKTCPGKKFDFKTFRGLIW